MSKLLAYIFADHHRGGGYPGRGIDDAPFAMTQIIAKALEDAVPWVISLGDAVNKAHSHADSPIPLRNQLRMLTKNGVRFGYIDGNHDRRNTSWLEDEDFLHLHGQDLHLGGETWHGVDFLPRGEVQEYLASSVPEHATGLFMHQGWGDFMHYEDSSQCDFAEIPGHVTRLATGDYHGECEISHHKNKDGQKLTVCSPGSTSVQSITEPGEKYMVALHSGDKPFRRIRLRSRELLRPSVINTPDDADKFLAKVLQDLDAAYARAASYKLPESMWRPLLHVTYSGDLTTFARRVERLVGEKAHLFWRELPPDKKDSAFKANLEAFKGDAFTPLSMLKQEIDVDDPDDPDAAEALELATTLYHCKDKADIARTAKNWLAEQSAKD